MGLLVALLSFVPGLVWLAWFVRYDRANPEPKRLVGAVFFLGMLSTLVAGFCNDFFAELLGADRDDVRGLFLLFFLVVGPVEETTKFLVVRLAIFKNKHFDEPMDGFVYAAAAALGFASLENLVYAVKYGTAVLVLRSLLSVPGHVLFSALWGYGLARKRFAGGSVLPWLVAAALLHGLYDFLVIGGGVLGAQFGFNPDVGHALTFLLGVVPLVVVQWILLLRLIGRLRKQGAMPALAADARSSSATVMALVGARTVSPALAANGECPRCAHPAFAGARFCESCGSPLRAAA